MEENEQKKHEQKEGILGKKGLKKKKKSVKKFRRK